MVIDGHLEVGIYSVLVYMTQRLLWPLTALGETLDLYQRSMASVRRITDLLEPARVLVPARASCRRRSAAPSSFETSGSATATAPTCCRDQRASSRPARPTRSSARPGRQVDAGPAAAALPRPAVGPGADRRHPTCASSRSARCAASIGYVSQDVFLFQGTVRENLAFGRPGATDAEIEDAAARWPRHTTSSSGCPRATTPSSASAARSSPVGSGSACRSPGRSCATRRSSCSTRPPRPSTTRPKPRSSGRSPRWRAAARRS